MGHPCERWGRQGELQRLVFLSVREALCSPAHPDSKRQARRKQRDLTRYGARVLKEANVLSCPPLKTSKRQEFRKMQAWHQAQRELVAARVAARLRGLTWTSVTGEINAA